MKPATSSSSQNQPSTSYNGDDEWQSVCMTHHQHLQIMRLAFGVVIPFVPVSNEAVIFSRNPVRPFAGHDCQENVRAYAVAMGAGPYSEMKFTVNRCSVCGLGFTEPIATENTAHLLYETRESNDFQPNDSPLVATLKGIATRSDVRRFVKGLDLPEGPMLDFGCGNAAFTIGMRDVFPTREVLGADLQDTPPSTLSASNYLTYSALFAGSRRYAFIICRHVLEHSYDPVGLLSSLYELLVPGGVLVLEVPSIETAVAKLFGKSWDGFYVPYHPIHFSRGSLRAVVEAAGFKAIREGGAEMPKMGRSIRNLVGGSYHLGLFALGALLQPVQVAIGMATNTSVCLRIWCQKPTDSANKGNL